MLKILTELCKKKIYACYYSDYNNTSKFIYGQILSVNSKDVAIYMISPDGLYDGILVKPSNYILRIETNGQYNSKMDRLCSLNELPPFSYSFTQEDIKDALLSIALKTKEIVSIELANSGFNDVVGFVEEKNDGYSKIRQIDEYGFEDGYSYIRVNDITQISYSSQDEKRILKLWKINNM